MRKKLSKKVACLTMALVMTLGSFVVSENTVKASSYPLVICTSGENQKCYVGDEVDFSFMIYPEYTNEKMSVNIYDSSGTCIAESEQEFYNYDTFSRKYTVQWDADDIKPGKYTVVATTSFYSYFDWHNCPSPERISLTVKNKPANGVNVIETKALDSQKIKVKFKKVSGAKKYQIKIGGQVKTVKKTTYVSKKLKADKLYTVSIRAKVGSKYGPWSPKRTVWVSDKEEI